MSAAETSEQRAEYERLLALVEDAVYDPARLRVLFDQVRDAELDPDDRDELLGRVGSYSADCQRARGIEI